MDKQPSNAGIHAAQQRVAAASWGSPVYQKQSNDMYNIQVTMQSCLDAGAPPELLSQIIAMFRRHHAEDEQMQAFINDTEVRYITSLEG